MLLTGVAIEAEGMNSDTKSGPDPPKKVDLRPELHSNCTASNELPCLIHQPNSETRVNRGIRDEIRTKNAGRESEINN